MLWQAYSAIRNHLQSYCKQVFRINTSCVYSKYIFLIVVPYLQGNEFFIGKLIIVVLRKIKAILFGR